jgi:hypothetical protein
MMEEFADYVDYEVGDCGVFFVALCNCEFQHGTVREFPPEARLDFGPRGIKITETEPLGDFPRKEGRKKFGYLH